MSIAIIVRAEDPGSCADLLRGLGIELEPPTATRPDAWRGLVSIDLQIAAGAAGGLAVSVATHDALGLARQLAERGGSIDFSQVRSDPPIVLVTGPNGERLALEERP